ncbi:hypothetical protein WT77_29275 [Burkholderia stagnalis]|nr:hypothetical protein WT77_29275 [Burkholderia stagnalis]
MPMFSSPDRATVRALLEGYLRAKDLNRPELIATCFAADAGLSFSLASDDIDFPARVDGAPAIAKTLVGDFGARFERCRTYCVCVEPHVNGDGACEMPWLVVMRQKDSGALRIGNGTYRWQFAREHDGAERIARLHIHIVRMDTIDDPRADRLDALHGALGYPWLPPHALARGLGEVAAAHPGWTFVQPFLQPAMHAGA